LEVSVLGGTGAKLFATAIKNSFPAWQNFPQDRLQLQQI